jgi:penicillin-binding protein A
MNGSSMQRSVRRVALMLMLLYLAIAAGLTYWQVVRAEALVYGEFNPRLLHEESQIVRGRMLDNSGGVLASSSPGVRGMGREYSDPSLAHVTGYYSARYGTSGLESSFSKFLRGDLPANPITAVVDRLLHRPRVGADLHLTIDPQVQASAVQVMGSDRGAVVAIDPRSGAVLAMVSTPYFDPGQVDAEWSRLQEDPARLLFNRATQGLYTPGSVFKVVTATAAIDLGLVDLDRQYSCTEDLVVDGFRIENKNHPGITTLTFAEDFAHSCNVTFAKTGLGLATAPLPVGDQLPSPLPWDAGIDESLERFSEYATHFGIDEPLPFDIPTSTSRLGSRPLSKVALANTAFGQGEVLVTPLLMGLSAATIANEGRMPQPYLVQEVLSPDGTVLQRTEPRVLRTVMSTETARAMGRLMVASVTDGYARPAQIPGVSVGGKTGSAETGPGERTHSWFIGYAPADNPRVAVAVIMENKGSGTDFAAPAGRAIMETALRR